MKFLIVLLLVAQLSLGQDADVERQLRQLQQRIAKDKIKKISDCIQDLIQNGDESVGLPILDPASFDEKTINLKSGRITLKNFKSEGGGSWNFPVLKESVTIFPPGLKLFVTILWPEAFVDTEYDVDLNIRNRTVQGVGHLTYHLTDLSVATEMHVKLPMKINSLSIKPHLGSMKFEVTDLNIDGVDRTEDINAFAPQFASWVNEHANEINKRLSQYIMDLINNRAYSEQDDLQTIVQRFLKCVKF